MSMLPRDILTGNCRHGYPDGIVCDQCMIDLLPPAPPAPEGVKFDTDKDPWHLIPYDAVRGIAKVLAFGAKKYGDRNWELGMGWSRPFAALQRHLAAWWEGEKADPETGMSHLWHAGCCLFFLIAYELRGVGRDDRPARVEQKEWR